MIRNGRIGVLPILVALAAFAVIAIWLANNRVEPPPPPATGKSSGTNEPVVGKPVAWAKQRTRALELQRDGKWCEAAQAWGKVLEQIPATAASPDRDEAEQNKRLADNHCQPEKPPVGELKIDPPAEDQRPQKASEAEVLKFYAPGRKVRSVALFSITGTGSNTAWMIRSNANFLYQYRVAVETTVKQNDGATVTFEQHFTAVDEMRAVSDQQFELRFPESPLIDLMWDQLEKQVLNDVPIYRVFKLFAKGYNTLDPNGQRALTRLSRFVPGVEKFNQLELAERVNELAGHKLEITYVSGLGVSFVKVLEPADAKLDPDTLTHLARGSSLFADYYISRADEAAEGEIVPVRAEDVGAIFSIGDQFNVSGEIELKKVASGGASPAASQLEVVGGSLEVEAPDGGATRRATLAPKRGTVEYAAAERLVRRAKLEWHTDTLWATRDHLLFGTTSTRNLDITSYYEAKLAWPDKAEGEAAE